jgi:hypothetical protein
VALEPHRRVLGAAFEWAAAHAPHFECSDDDITQAYWQGLTPVAMLRA